MHGRDFTRVLGSRGASEPILIDLLSAWRQAQTGDGTAAVRDVAISDRRVNQGQGMHARGALVVAVRAEGDGESYLIEVQHRAEAFFPHRALLYSAAEVVTHHLSNPGSLEARRVHTLAFCDYDFMEKEGVQSGGGGGGAPGGPSLRTAATRWRATASHTRNPARALQVFGLHVSPRAMAGAEVNAALARVMAAHSSFVFALLPHAPRLEELCARTPPLLRWASLVAHAAPGNLDTVPREVRTGGVARLLELLDASEAEARAERGDEEREAATIETLISDMRAEAKVEGRAEGKAEGQAEGRAEGKVEGKAEGQAEGRAEGKAEGRAEGKAELLRSLGITSAATFRARFGDDPPPDVAHLLEPTLGKA